MNKKVSLFAIVLIALLAFGSCKPKQSTYKSVYESAKGKQMEEEVTYEPASYPTQQPVSDYQSSAVRKEKVTPVYASDASGLKAYNVVIAAMAMKPNAESLKTRMEQAGQKIILVQNEQGMYRVIIASADTKEEAVAKRSQILSLFQGEANADGLRAKYGIPFDDWWILQREY